MIKAHRKRNLDGFQQGLLTSGTFPPCIVHSIRSLPGILSTMSIAGYRRLLRSIKVTFAGDHFAIAQATKVLKEEFYNNRNSTNFESHLKDIEEADDMLRFHIVQAKKSERGNFG